MTDIPHMRTIIEPQVLMTQETSVSTCALEPKKLVLATLLTTICCGDVRKVGHHESVVCADSVEPSAIEDPSIPCRPL